MAGEKMMYRRVSVTKKDGQVVPYDARVDVEADPVSGTVVYKVHSQALAGRSVKFRSFGNAAEDVIHLESVCQRVYEFDQQYRARPVPKPGMKQPSPRREMAVNCLKCGDAGWYEDETGYEMVCECRS